MTSNVDIRIPRGGWPKGPKEDGAMSEQQRKRERERERERERKGRRAMWYLFVRHIRDQPTGCTGLRHRHPVSYRERNLRLSDNLQFLIGQASRNVVLSRIFENEDSTRLFTSKFPDSF